MHKHNRFSGITLRRRPATERPSPRERDDGLIEIPNARLAPIAAMRYALEIFHTASAAADRTPGAPRLPLLDEARHG